MVSISENTLPYQRDHERDFVANPSPLAIAHEHAKRGRPVVPICQPDPDGNCTCGGAWDASKGVRTPHERRAVGKAPVGRLASRGIASATTSSPIVSRWWHAEPNAGVGVEIEAAGWIVVDCDSPEIEAACRARGLDGGVIRESRNHAFVFRRPPDCPLPRNLIRSGGDPLDILIRGNFVVHGTHHTGAAVRMDPTAEPGFAPAWVIELLREKAAREAAQTRASDAQASERTATGGGTEPPVRLSHRGLERWDGTLVERRPDGSVDRSRSLFLVGLCLAEAGATTHTVAEAVAERDAALGWAKFSGRRDADAQYRVIAEKVVAHALKREPEPQVSAASSADAPSVYETRRLQRALLNRDDQIEVQANVIRALRAELAGIRGVLRNATLSSSDKVAVLVVSEEAHRRRGRSYVTDMATAGGVSVDTISNAQRRKRLFGAGAPVRWEVKEGRRRDGGDRPDSVLTVRAAQGASLGDTLLAYAAVLVEKTGHGGRREPSLEVRTQCCPDGEIVASRYKCNRCGRRVNENGWLVTGRTDVPHLAEQDTGIQVGGRPDVPHLAEHPARDTTPRSVTHLEDYRRRPSITPEPPLAVSGGSGLAVRPRRQFARPQRPAAIRAARREARLRAAGGAS